MSEPVVSILMPVWNAADTLEESLASILGQTFTAWELVCVDDGSTDGTPEMLERWRRRDHRVRVLRRRRRGISAALNAGLAVCRGEWIARMDADDRMLPGRLEAQLEFAQTHPEIALTGGLVRHVADPAQMPNTTGMERFVQWVNSVVTPEEIRRDLLVDCPVPHPTFFLRRSLLVEMGGYTLEPVPEDYDLVLRLYRRGLVAGKVPQEVVEWTDRPGRASRTHPAYSIGALRELKIRHLCLTDLAGVRPFIVWGAGDVGKRFVLCLQKHGRQPEAFVDLDPRKFGKVIHGCPVWTPEEFLQRRGEGWLTLCAVGAPGAREDIRKWMRSAGLSEERDFRFVA
ncbi:MAG: glycosyltransferase [Armatimonadota bacterium]